MILSILLRHGATGEVRVLERFEPLFHLGRVVWTWTRGNYSCDCNRSIFFERAAGNEMHHLPRCSEGKFLVRILDENDEVLYAEF